MPSVPLTLEQHSSRNANSIPDILRTPSGTILLEIQGIINVGETPLTRTELDLGPSNDLQHGEPIRVGEIDLSQVTETGSPVKLYIGESQLLRGTVTKIKSPLAVLDVTNATESSDISVLDIITHKVVFNSRPEPVIKQSF